MIRYVGIIGGGPSGLYAAWLLAQSGIQVTVFDHQIPFEKPCGGGLTQKIFHDFPDLKFLANSSQTVEKFSFSASDTRLTAEVSDNKLLYIISRKVLGEVLLDRCFSIGVRLVSQRVIDIKEKNIIIDDGRQFPFDFIIGADGANGVSRKKLSLLEYDRWGGVGFYIQGLTVPTAHIYFDVRRKGYLWVFPRTDHASVGFIALKGNISKTNAEEVIQEYLDKNYFGFKLDPDKYYAATIPLTKKYDSQLLYSNQFALIGDAAGLVDPITGEGIYYAFASANYLAEAIIANDITVYKRKLEQLIFSELQKSADIFERFYNPFILTNMVRLGFFSQTISTILVRLIAGKQSYLNLKKKLIDNIPVIFDETIKTMLLGK